VAFPANAHVGLIFDVSPNVCLLGAGGGRTRNRCVISAVGGDKIRSCLVKGDERGASIRKNHCNSSCISIRFTYDFISARSHRISVISHPISVNAHFILLISLNSHHFRSFHITFRTFFRKSFRSLFCSFGSFHRSFHSMRF
jgi:hypothetical protein